jgi:hypothetical protein
MNACCQIILIQHLKCHRVNLSNNKIWCDGYVHVKQTQTLSHTVKRLLDGEETILLLARLITSHLNPHVGQITIRQWDAQVQQFEHSGMTETLLPECERCFLHIGSHPRCGIPDCWRPPEH